MPMRKSVRRALGITAAAGAGYALWRSYTKRRVATGAGSVDWEAQPFPYPPQPSTVPPPRESAPAAQQMAELAAWVEPPDDGSCPLTHPVKAKVASGIFHVEGGANYARTKADRCYASAEAAETDGLRPAKR
jgi:hypothetical protein